LPIVAFKNEGYEEFLRGTKGEDFLVEPRNFEKLAEKISILIENPSLREEMRKFANTEIGKYSWEGIAQRILDFYQLCQNYKSQKIK